MARIGVVDVASPFLPELAALLGKADVSVIESLRGSAGVVRLVVTGDRLPPCCEVALWLLSVIVNTKRVGPFQVHDVAEFRPAQRLGTEVLAA